MTQPHPSDIQAVPGSSLGSSEKEDRGVVDTAIANDSKSLSNLFNTTLNSIKHRLSSMSDSTDSTKYPADPSVSYIANGVISVNSEKGKFVLSKNSNEPTVGALTVDQSQSSFYSPSTNTTLGSTLISTVDGYVMNPLGTLLPSSYFTPARMWEKNLLPQLVVKSAVTLVVIGAIQLLLKQINKDKYSFVRETKDLGTIIIENKDFEDKILNRKLSQS